MKKCKYCGKPFNEYKKYSTYKRYCSRACGRADYRLNGGNVKFMDYTKNMGTYSELQACCDLMKKGYDVFRCISPHSEFDLIAHKKPYNFIRIEVKTGYISNHTKALYYSKPRNDEYDIIAVFTKNDQKIRYIARTKESVGFGILTEEIKP